MMIGALTMGVCSILLAILGSINHFRLENAKLDYELHLTLVEGGQNVVHQLNRTSIAFVVFTFILVFTFGCTWGPIGWIYPVELFSYGGFLLTTNSSFA